MDDPKTDLKTDLKIDLKIDGVPMAMEAVTAANFEDWCALAAELWPPEDEADYQDLRQTMTDILHLDRETGWIVRDGAGEAMAFINLSLRQDYVAGATGQPVAFVEGLYVRAAHRRQGVGRALIAWAETWARQQGCAELASDALIENEASYQFHTQAGFAEVERVVCFIKRLDRARE